MSEDRTGKPMHTVCEGGVHYVVNADGRKLGVLMPLEEYERYLDLLGDEQTSSQPEGLIHPTRLVPAERLDKLTGLVAIGGDALADSEALYDPDWC